jgi:hypothetical protein
VQFSSFMIPDSFLTILRLLHDALTIYAPTFTFDSCEVGAIIFHILRFQTHFRWSHRRCVHFSRFILHNSFSTILGSLHSVFQVLCCRIHFGDLESDMSIFYILCSITHFIWYRDRCMRFSIFRIHYSFSTIPGLLFLISYFALPLGVLTDQIISNFIRDMIQEILKIIQSIYVSGDIYIYIRI